MSDVINLDDELRRALGAAREEIRALQEENARLSHTTASDSLPYAPATRWEGMEVPQREWLWDQWIPMYQTTALYGDGGMGKTLFAQQLATSVALGRDFMGISTTGGPVMGIFCEDDEAELHRRQQSVNEWLGCEMGDLERLYPVSRVGRDNLLITFDGQDEGSLTPFWAELDQRLGIERPVLLCVDTAADTFGGNENARPQVRQFIQLALTRLAIKHRCAVLLLAHPSAAGLSSGEGTGGSTAWNNSVRSRMYLQRDPDDESVTVLTRKKSNYAAQGEQLQLYWQDGAFWQSGSNIDKKNKEEAAKRILLAVVQRQIKKGLFTSPMERSPSYAPKVAAKAGDARLQRISRKQFITALDEMLDSGELVVNETRSGLRLEEGGSQ